MSFGMSSLVPQAGPAEFNIRDDNYGVPSAMVSGLSGTRQTLGCAHPLEASERNYEKNRLRMDMSLLRKTQGLHAPLRLAMELKATEQIGRLPFLPSSNLMKDAILGRVEDIGFEDILNTAEFREQMGQPHAMVEKSLGIL